MTTPTLKITRSTQVDGTLAGENNATEQLRIIEVNATTLRLVLKGVTFE